jgi:hypothetical protein
MASEANGAPSQAANMTPPLTRAAITLNCAAIRVPPPIESTILARLGPECLSHLRLGGWVPVASFDGSFGIPARCPAGSPATMKWIICLLLLVDACNGPPQTTAPEPQPQPTVDASASQGKAGATPASAPDT